MTNWEVIKFSFLILSKKSFFVYFVYFVVKNIFMLLTQKQSAEEGLKDVFRFLLENKRVTGIFTLKKIHSNGAVGYALITDTSEIKDCCPLYPSMPVNAAQSLSLLTLREVLTEPIAACIRPCELRAFVELVKLKQGNLENIFMMSSTCGGVYPLKMAVADEIGNNLDTYRAALQNVEIAEKIRPTCKGCEYFIPYHSDVTVALIGKNPEEACHLLLHTDKAKEFLNGIDGEMVDSDLDGPEVTMYRDKRIAEREKLFTTMNLEQSGFEGLVRIYGKCIGCHGCSSVCPICYCGLCFFDSKINELPASSYEAEMRKRGAIRVPGKTIFYHIGRLSHVSISCVGCGACSDVCPVNIPLSSVFLKTSHATQGMYEYVAGRDAEEPIPLQIYKEQELADFEQ